MTMKMPLSLLCSLILVIGPCQGLMVAIAQETVISKDEDAASTSRSITLNDGSRKDFEHLHLPSDVRRIYLRNCDINDISLKRLEGLTQLQYLSLEGSKIKGDGLEVLKSLPALKSLSLNGTRITDESLKHLHSIKNLTILLLNDTDVSDDGTTTLALLPRLEWLYLNRTKVTDASMKKLGNLRDLRFLSLLGTSVSDSGVADLHAIVPSVRVRR
jgi:Leucine-rich repeat (LRR) protein